MGERILRFFIVGLFLIIPIGFISAESCWIDDADSTGCSTSDGTVILRFSSITNAHGEEWDQSTYPYVICCDFTGTHTCNGSNKVLGLSSSTNAHAEIPEYDNSDYPVDVCFSDLICIDILGPCNSSFPIQTVSLSSDTNAHIAEYNSYGRNICCRRAEAPLIPNIFWSLDGNTERITTAANPLEINLGDVIYLVIENSGYPVGTIPFNVYEADPWFNDSIGWLPGNVDTERKAVATWTITEDDLKAASGFGDQEPNIYDDFEFYFKAGTSEEFESGIFYTVYDPPPTPEPNLYWATNDVAEIPITGSLSVSTIPHYIKAIINNSGITPGQLATFNIKEKDAGPDDLIWTGTAVVDNDGKAVLVFQIDSGNLTKANEPSINDEMKFYFKIGAETSDELLFTYDPALCDGVSLCSHYNSFPNPVVDCWEDPCVIGANNCPKDFCECQWNDIDGGCNQVGYDEPNISTNVCVWCIDDFLGNWCDMPEGINDYCDTTGTGCGTGTVLSNSFYCTIDFAIGSCVYLTDDSIDPEGCEDDGYLTYTWGGKWNWNEVANAFTFDPDGGDFLQDPPGTWRYDPLRMSVDCNAQGGTNSVLCPAQIELPFFGTWGILVTIALIIIIYVALNLKKHKPKKRKKK